MELALTTNTPPLIAQRNYNNFSERDSRDHNLIPNLTTSYYCKTIPLITHKLKELKLWN
jgi:hypothetical protein